MQTAIKRAISTSLVVSVVLVFVSCFDIVIRPAFEGCLQDSDCNSGLSCEVGRCENETCVFAVSEGFCAVGGETCYNEGQEEPGNRCRVCDPSQSQTSLVDKDCAGQDCDVDTGVCAGASDEACTSYCDLMETTCVDENAQYIDRAHCLVTCIGTAAWKIGDLEKDQQVNTISCRYYHATTVADGGSAEVHCPHAGPSGGAFCGSWCENFCALAAKNCSGVFRPDFGGQSCEEACASFSTAGSALDTAGDTVQCRINQMLLAGEKASGGPNPGGPDLFCSEGSLVSNTCSDPSPVTKGLIINEVDHVAPVSFGSGARFVEIYNPTQETMSLKSYTLFWADADQKSLFMGDDGSVIPFLDLGKHDIPPLEPGAYLIIGEYGVERHSTSKAFRVNVELNKSAGQGGVMLQDAASGHEDVVDHRVASWAPLDESATEALSLCEGKWILVPLSAGAKNDCP